MNGLTKCGIHTYEGVLFSVKRMEILLYATTNLTLTSQSQKDKYCMNLLISIKCRETVNIKRWLATAGVKVEREICLLNFRFSKWKSYGGLFFYNTVNKLSTTEPHWKMVDCQVYVFYIKKRILYKWNHRICNLMRLAFFIQHNSLEIIQVVLCIKLFLSSIFRSTRCTTVYSPNEGHLRCFQLPVITNKATMNIFR